MKIILNANKFALLGLIILISFNMFALAKTPSIYPEPQKMVFSRERFVVPPVSVKTYLPLQGHLNEMLKSMFPATASTSDFSFVIKKPSVNIPDLQRSEAYRLTILRNGITIEAGNQRAVFYALQTLLQLAGKDASGSLTLPAGEITDFPDVAFRGTVEGFYGEPWSHQDRIEQLRFYGKLKLNTYIYGPKDDPYHSSPNWRIPYPEDKALLIRELVGEAKRNEVDFVWAIHPGKDIQWNLTDSLAILKKMEMMYALGVRSFAVFFDDISGSGTDALKQAGLLNYLQKDFIRKKGDGGSLIMCPTEYNKSWSDPRPGTYLDILGEKLDPAVHIMWTGNRVVDDITKEGLQWVNKRINRKAFVWWNFPVSDYVRDHLLMGPSYGLDINAATDLSGFVSNPMDKAEASKPAIFSVALYAWNMKTYLPAKAWRAANNFIMPEAPAAFQLFNTHNSDPGPNGHRYRREESVEIKPTVDAFLLSYSKGEYRKELAEIISAEFEAIVPVASQIKTKSKNLRLVEQISPWLTQFELLGKAGTTVMQTASLLNQKDLRNAWPEYLKAEMLLDSMAVIDKTFNQNPYQPGVKSGSLVLMPFIREVFKQTGESFFKTSANLSLKDQEGMTTFLFTNSEKLRNQPLLRTNSSVAISPVLEALTLNRNEYVGVRLADDLKATELQFNLESGNLLTWGRFEMSADGNTWNVIKPVEKRGKGSVSGFNEPVKFVRFINFSDTIQNLFLKSFQLSIEAVAGQDRESFTLDASLQTFATFSRQSPAKITLPANFQNSALGLLLKSKGEKIAVYSINRRGKKKLIYQGDEQVFTIPAGKIHKTKSMLFDTESAYPIRIYEIFRN